MNPVPPEISPTHSSSQINHFSTSNLLGTIRIKALESENTKLKSDKKLLKEILKNLQEQYKFGNEYLNLVDD